VGDGGTEDFGDGLAHVSESVADAEICGGNVRRREDEDGDVVVEAEGERLLQVLRN
jgi:hypothetical protein